MADREELLQLLNRAFGLEYSDVFLYLKEADALRGKRIGAVELDGLFEKYSQMELRHADRLAMKIIALGSIAQWEFKPMYAGGSITEILDRHVAHEQEAIALYDRVIELADDNDFELVVRGIRDDEREHARQIIRLRDEFYNAAQKGTGQSS